MMGCQQAWMLFSMLSKMGCQSQKKMKNASMQRWTPKPVKVQIAKLQTIDLWTDKPGGANEHSVKQP